MNKTASKYENVSVVKEFRNNSGFTIIELLVTISFIAILSNIALPNLREFNDQISVANNTRAVMLKLAKIRTEAIREKKTVRINFSENGFSWDFDLDHSYDGSFSFLSHTTWDVIPDDLIFDGFGFARAVNKNQTLALHQGTQTKFIKVSTNGHIQA